MNQDKAAVGLRLSIRGTLGSTGDGGSLENIITDKFPDGALCFVLENRALYQLDKTSTQTADGVTIVDPIGGPGRWVILGQSAGASAFVEIVGTAENAALTSGTPDFVAIAGAEFDWQPTGAPAGFALTASGGVITYNGVLPTRARVTFTGSVYGVGSEAAGTVWGAVALNGDVLGLDPSVSFLPGTQTTEVGGPGLPQVLSAQRLLDLDPGDTLQIALATDNGHVLTLSRGTLSVLLG